jgi:hypothetical protein
MHVRVVRRGGLAGIPMRGEIETSELPAQQAALADAALRGLPADAAPAPPHHPDGFQYEIAFSPADGASRSMLIDEAEVSDALRPVIDSAMDHATLG